MATHVESCTVLGQSGLTDNFGDLRKPEYVTNETVLAGRSDIGGGYYTGIIKFKTPNFPIAASEYLKFNISIGATNSTGIINLRYAVCTSDENYANYYGVYGEVSDNNRLETGTVRWSMVAGSIAELTIKGRKFKANTEYYLFLWAATSAINNDVQISYPIWQDKNRPGHNIELGYNRGIVYIDNGGELSYYQCYIDNGSDWDVFIPYIDNGTSWDLCS